MKPQINRRTFFRGATLTTGSLLLRPALEQIQAASDGRAAVPRRFVFVLEGNGLDPWQIQPPGIKRQKDAHGHTDNSTLESLPLAGQELPEAIAALRPLQDRLCILQGLSGRICGGGHSNNFGALGAFPGNSGPSGETIDMTLARALPAIFPQIGLGISDRPEHGIIYNVSASASNKPMPTQCRPDLAWEEMFGGAAEGAARGKFLARTNLLDFMAEDIRRVQSRLDAAEKEKLGHYLNAYESLRERRSRLMEISPRLRRDAPPVTDKFTSQSETDRLDAQFDLGAAALICGLTNVLTIASGCGDPYFSVRWKGLGVDLDKHSIGHGKGLNERTAAQLTTTIRRYHMELIARLAEKLRSVPEGSGSMLDNTLIIYLSDGAEAHHSRCWDWPLLVIGDLGRRLTSAGRYLCYPKYGNPGHRTMASFFLTLLHAAGAPRKSFGIPDPNLKDIDQSGPLQEIC
jgi:hypothetical protein